MEQEVEKTDIRDKIDKIIEIYTYLGRAPEESGQNIANENKNWDKQGIFYFIFMKF